MLNCGDNSVGRKLRTTNTPYGKNLYTAKNLTAKIPTVKILSREIPSTTIDRVGPRLDRLGHMLDVPNLILDRLDHMLDRLVCMLDIVGHILDKLGRKLDRLGPILDTPGHMLGRLIVS